jgi:hypothetical protein
MDKCGKIEEKEKYEKPEDGLLEYFYPMPAELRDTTADGTKRKKLQKKYGFDDWYGWAVKNWSTKWDIHEFHGVDRNYINDDESEISFGFESAWAPPIGAYEKFIDDNSNCSIKATYYEGGCDFMGEWYDGQDDCYQVSDFKSDDDFWKTGVGSTLDDLYGITESMAEYEAQLEAEKEDVHEYTKGEKVNVD